MYAPYNTEVEKTFQGKKPYALFFHATWCPACRQADDEIKANLANLPASTAIFQVDYDSNMELRKKYGVTSQHTVVFIDANGEVKNKVMGFGLDDIKNNFK